MEYLARKPFIMNILQTVTSRKHLKGSSLRAGNGGYPLGRTRKEGKDLFHKAKKIDTSERSNHA
jgi:hypothetical protein